MLKEQHLKISIAVPCRVWLFSNLTQSQPLSMHYELCDRCATTTPLLNFKASLESIKMLQHLSESCRDWKGVGIGGEETWASHIPQAFFSQWHFIRKVNSVQARLQPKQLKSSKIKSKGKLSLKQQKLMTLTINGTGISAINTLQILLTQDKTILKVYWTPQKGTNLHNSTTDTLYKVISNGRQPKRFWRVLSDHRVIYITGVLISSTTGSLWFSLSFHPYMFM